MGLFTSKLEFSDLSIFIFGVPGSGKRTIQSKLDDTLANSSSQIVTQSQLTTPMFAFRHRGAQISVFNLPILKIHPLLRHYYGNGLRACIYVVDAIDSTSLGEVDAFLHCQDSDQLLDDDCLFLIWVNKIDLPNGMTSNDVHKALKCDQLKHKCLVLGCCALTGQGLEEGIHWIAEQHDIKLEYRN